MLFAGGALSNGVTVESTLSGTGATELWTISVPYGTTSMHCVLTMKNAGPDFDLYGSWGSAPSTSYYDWRAYTTGAHLKGDGENYTYFGWAGMGVDSGTWYIMVRSYSGSGGYKLTCNLLGSRQDTSIPEIKSGEEVGSYLGGDCVYETWRINVPSNTASMRVILNIQSSSLTDFDIYGRKSFEPDEDNLSYNFSSIRVGGEDYTYTSPSAGTWYIKVIRYTSSDMGDYGLRVVLTPNISATTLTSGTAYSGTLSSGASKMFKISAGANLKNMRTVLTCGSNNFNLYAKYEGAPTTSSYDWCSTASTGEDYTYDLPGQGTWYILVKAVTGSGSYSVTTYLNSSTVACGTQYPVILAHGMGATDKMFGVIDYFWGVKSALLAKGCPVYITQVNCMDSTANKAAAWRDQVNQILASTGKAKFNIIGHSHGTIYTRYALSNLGLGSKCASYTSISGVHQGSSVADVVTGVLGDTGGWLIGKILDYVYANFCGDTAPNSLQNARDLTMGYMRNTFNATTPNVPGVYYQSYAGRIKTVTSNLFLEPTYLLIKACEANADNDGLCSVYTQTWGTFRGTTTGAWWCGGVDHFKIVGQMFGFTPGFSAPNYFCDIVADLKAKGY